MCPVVMWTGSSSDGAAAGVSAGRQRPEDPAGGRSAATSRDGEEERENGVDWTLLTNTSVVGLPLTSFYSVWVIPGFLF